MVNLNRTLLYLGDGDGFLDCGGGELPRLDPGSGLQKEKKRRYEFKTFKRMTATFEKKKVQKLKVS